MIATRELELTIEGAQETAEAYISTVFDTSYFPCEGQKVDDGYRFLVACTREDMNRDPAVGSVSISAFGEVDILSEDRIRDMKEAAEVQAAQQRGELARDENGLVLRRHARIKANSWLSDYVDLKLGAAGGVYIPAESPLWRFHICDFWVGGDEPILDVIDVDAVTGEVLKLTEEQLNLIVRGASATRKRQEYTPAADQ